MPYEKNYDIIVVGGGHAGCEAACIAAKRGLSTLLLTINVDTIAKLSCNPAMGGLAKGHLIKEIDFLGGVIGLVTDRSAIQYRVLNRSKGPAVWSPRAQVDRFTYLREMLNVLESERSLSIKQDTADELVVEDGVLRGVKTKNGIFYGAGRVVLTPGTFLKGLIHLGLKTFPAGRSGEFPSDALSGSLSRAGFTLGRLKTGTPPRISRKTVDFSKLAEQKGDPLPIFFSRKTKDCSLPQVSCFITETSAETRDIIMSGLDRSPLYSGKIKGMGPRYCPSIEDKMVKFPHRQTHHIFLEPEGLDRDELYANGLSTSLPEDIQVRFIRSVRGLEHAEIVRFGYAIEYDYINPVHLLPTLESRSVKGLYFAGQVNGTSGYEEAAAQGFMAGLNAALSAMGQPPFILDRSESYIGVLIDDLITKGAEEPYRLFTSRAEHRITLRQDNVDLRLFRKAYAAGLIGEAEYAATAEKEEKIKSELEKIRKIFIVKSGVPAGLVEEKNINFKNRLSLYELLRNPNVKYGELSLFYPAHEPLDPDAGMQVEINAKYESYLKQQDALTERFRRLEDKRIPADIDYDSVKGLSNEGREKFKKLRPYSLGQAGRISGLSPADLVVLMAHIK